MTAEQYMDKERFPLSTADGASLEEQLQIDAINWDDLERAKKDGIKLDKHKRAILKELRYKGRFEPPLPAA